MQCAIGGGGEGGVIVVVVERQYEPSSKHINPQSNSANSLRYLNRKQDYRIGSLPCLRSLAAVKRQSGGVPSHTSCQLHESCFYSAHQIDVCRVQLSYAALLPNAPRVSEAQTRTHAKRQASSSGLCRIHTVTQQQQEQQLWRGRGPNRTECSRPAERWRFCVHSAYSGRRLSFLVPPVMPESGKPLSTLSLTARASWIGRFLLGCQRRRQRRVRTITLIARLPSGQMTESSTGRRCGWSI